MRSFAVAVAGGAGLAAAANNGLARKPTMALNMWNSLFCNYNVTDLEAIAQLVVSEGYAAAGYTTFSLDDCWQSGRQPNGTIIPDPKVWGPAGIQPFFDFIHSLGLRTGIYSDAGTNTCAGRPGGYGYETIDAATYAAWNISYLKYDNCNNQNVDPRVRYGRMAGALNATGHAIEFSACIWGTSNPWTWMQPVANSWRIDDDIANSWDSFMRVLSNAHGLSQFAGPGAWNDLDMLQVGNFNSMEPDAEGQLHFALWALYKSPLLIGTDLRKASAATKATLQNAEIIAVSQDDLGVPGDIVWQQGPNRVYAGPLADGGRAVLLTNMHHYGSQYAFDNVTVPFGLLGYSQFTAATVRDMYAHADLGVFTGSFTGSVPLHGVLALRVTPVAPEERDTAWRPWHRVAVTAAGAQQ